MDKLLTGWSRYLGIVRHIPAQVLFELATWWQIECAALDLLKEPPMVAEHLIVRGPVFESAGLDDADEFGTERGIARPGNGLARDIVTAEIGSEPIDQAGADATFVSD